MEEEINISKTIHLFGKLLLIQRALIIEQKEVIKPINIAVRKILSGPILCKTFFSAKAMSKAASCAARHIFMSCEKIDLSRLRIRAFEINKKINKDINM